jgi:hypothetical protein
MRQQKKQQEVIARLLRLKPRESKTRNFFFVDGGIFSRAKGRVGKDAIAATLFGRLRPNFPNLF